MSNQVITVGYLKSFVSEFSDIKVKTNEKDDYCPTYKELTDNSFVTQFSGNTTPSLLINGIRITNTFNGNESYTESQLVTRNSLEAVYKVLTGCSVTSKDSYIDCCGGSTVLTINAKYKTVVKTENGKIDNNEFKNINENVNGTFKDNAPYTEIKGNKITFGENSVTYPNDALLRCTTVTGYCSYIYGEEQHNTVRICQNENTVHNWETSGSPYDISLVVTVENSLDFNGKCTGGTAHVKAIYNWTQDMMRKDDCNNILDTRVDKHNPDVTSQTVWTTNRGSISNGILSYPESISLQPVVTKVNGTYSGITSSAKLTQTDCCYQIYHYELRAHDKTIGCCSVDTSINVEGRNRVETVCSDGSTFSSWSLWETIENNKDYTISNLSIKVNNTDRKKTYTRTITGKNNYTGKNTTATITQNIGPCCYPGYNYDNAYVTFEADDMGKCDETTTIRNVVVNNVRIYDDDCNYRTVTETPSSTEYKVTYNPNGINQTRVERDVIVTVTCNSNYGNASGNVTVKQFAGPCRCDDSYDYTDAVFTCTCPSTIGKCWNGDTEKLISNAKFTNVAHLHTDCSYTYEEDNNPSFSVSPKTIEKNQTIDEITHKIIVTSKGHSNSFNVVQGAGPCECKPDWSYPSDVYVTFTASLGACSTEPSVSNVVLHNVRFRDTDCSWSTINENVDNHFDITSKHTSNDTGGERTVAVTIKTHASYGSVTGSVNVTQAYCEPCKESWDYSKADLAVSCSGTVDKCGTSDSTTIKRYVDSVTLTGITHTLTNCNTETVSETVNSYVVTTTSIGENNTSNIVYPSVCVKATLHGKEYTGCDTVTQNSGPCSCERKWEYPSNVYVTFTASLGACSTKPSVSDVVLHNVRFRDTDCSWSTINENVYSNFDVTSEHTSNDTGSERTVAVTIKTHSGYGSISGSVDVTQAYCEPTCTEKDDYSKADLAVSCSGTVDKCGTSDSTTISNYISSVSLTGIVHTYSDCSTGYTSESVDSYTVTTKSISANETDSVTSVSICVKASLHNKDFSGCGSVSQEAGPCTPPPPSCPEKDDYSNASLEVSCSGTVGKCGTSNATTIKGYIDSVKLTGIVHTYSDCTTGTIEKSTDSYTVTTTSISANETDSATSVSICVKASFNGTEYSGCGSVSQEAGPCTPVQCNVKSINITPTNQHTFTSKTETFTVNVSFNCSPSGCQCSQEFDVTDIDGREYYGQNVTGSFTFDYTYDNVPLIIVSSVDESVYGEVVIDSNITPESNEGFILEPQADLYWDDLDYASAIIVYYCPDLNDTSNKQEVDYQCISWSCVPEITENTSGKNKEYTVSVESTCQEYGNATGSCTITQEYYVPPTPLVVTLFCQFSGAFGASSGVAYNGCNQSGNISDGESVELDLTNCYGSITMSSSDKQLKSITHWHAKTNTSTTDSYSSSYTISRNDVSNGDKIYFDFYSEWA